MKIKQLPNLLLIFILLNTSFQISQINDIKSYLRSLSDKNLKEFMSSGSLNGYWSVKEVFDYLNRLTFVIEPFKKSQLSIGKTVKGLDIPVYRLSSTIQANSNNFLIQKTDKNSIIYISNQHAREISSYHMSIYYITYLIRGYLNNDKSVIEILKYNDLYFVPIVNIDGVVDIQSEIEYLINNNKPFNIINQIRKNRNNRKDIFQNIPLSVSQQYNGFGNGVDINRNYGFSWGFDNIGSSNNPLDPTFRGLFPFSEPETKAIRDLINHIQMNSKINFILDIHSYGNLFLLPESPTIKSTQLRTNFAYEYNQYIDIFNKGNFPRQCKVGTPSEVIGYSANGDLMQYLFFSQKILNAGIELGTSEYLTNNFFPDIKIMTNEIIPKNLFPIYFISKYFLYNLSLKTISLSFTPIKNEYISKFYIENHGFIEYNHLKSKVNVYITLNKEIPILKGRVQINNLTYNLDPHKDNKIPINFSIQPIEKDKIRFIPLEIVVVSSKLIQFYENIYSIRIVSEDLIIEEKSLIDVKYSFGNEYLNNFAVTYKASKFVD